MKSFHFSTAIYKSAWIDTSDKLIAFHSVGGRVEFTASEAVFWPRIMDLVKTGYLLE